ncbi:hypothetical protein, partial [Roseateles sp.]|uniref:hypothetical protein n=1 Tax=Roseateles sp. TaxID=1971397 RepID=UPI002F3EA21A
AVPDARVPARQPAPPEPALVAPAAPRKRAASPHPDAPIPKRSAISAHALKQIQAEQRAIQERQLARLPNAPNTALPDLDGDAKTGRTHQEAADTERALAQARKNAMQDALRARPRQGEPSIPDPTDVDESWEVLSLLSDGDLPEMDGLDPTSAPKAPGTLRRAASESTLDRAASGTTPESQRTVAALRPAVSDPELRSRLPALHRTIADLDTRMPAIFDALVAAPLSVGARLAAQFQRGARIDVEEQVELQLRPLVVQLRRGYRETYGGNGGAEEEAFVARSLHDAAAKAAGRYAPPALGDIAARLDKSGGVFRHAEAHAAQQRKLSISLALDDRFKPRQMRQQLLDESGLLTYVLTGVRNAVERGAAAGA